MDHENYLGILLTKNGTQLYITKHIGEGATSFVYLAIDKYNKEYALKLYKNSESYFNEINKIRKILPSKYIVKDIPIFLSNYSTILIQALLNMDYSST